MSKSDSGADCELWLGVLPELLSGVLVGVLDDDAEPSLELTAPSDEFPIDSVAMCVSFKLLVDLVVPGMLVQRNQGYLEEG